MPGKGLGYLLTVIGVLVALAGAGLSWLVTSALVRGSSTTSGGTSDLYVAVMFLGVAIFMVGLVALFLAAPPAEASVSPSHTA